MEHDHSSHSVGGGATHDSLCMASSSMPGMTMYMTGFHSTLFESDLPCLNLYSTKCTLNSEGKVLMAMMGVVGLGILVEALPLWRFKYLARVERDGLDREGKNVTLVLSAFHGLQAFLGYLLMLGAMTYSIELLLSAVVGISLGHNIFYKKRQILRRNQSSNDAIVDSGTPCCEFLQDDADDGDSMPFAYSQIGSESIIEGRDNESTLLHQRPNAGSGLENAGSSDGRNSG